MQERNITFIGAGNMAQAMIYRLVNKGYPAHLITVCAPSKTNLNILTKRYGIKSISDNLYGVRSADVIILAVKPQSIVQVCNPIRKNIDLSKKLIISIVAGVTVSRFYSLLGNNINIVRVIPNTPCLIGQGMSGLYTPLKTCSKDREFSTQLISMLGKIYWLEKENYINGMIAAASSAPAYFFMFMAIMQKQTQAMGFDAKTAHNIVLQTAIGSVALAAEDIDIPFSILQKKVTSKGGTTAAALLVFEQQGLSSIIANAMQAAVARSEEMEKLF